MKKFIAKILVLPKHKIEILNTAEARDGRPHIDLGQCTGICKQ